MTLEEFLIGAGATFLVAVISYASGRVSDSKARNDYYSVKDNSAYWKRKSVVCDKTRRSLEETVSLFRKDIKDLEDRNAYLRGEVARLKEECAGGGGECCSPAAGSFESCAGRNPT